jgi:hypothetical protein
MRSIVGRAAEGGAVLLKQTLTAGVSALPNKIFRFAGFSVRLSRGGIVLVAEGE